MTAVTWTPLGDDLALEDAVEALDALPFLTVVMDDLDPSLGFVWVKLPHADGTCIWLGGGDGSGLSSEQLADLPTLFVGSVS